MKKYLYIILTLFICTASENKIAKLFIPDWYTGDKELYLKFIHACYVANKSCPDKLIDESGNEINCHYIKDINEFNIISMRVNTCLLSLREPVKKISTERTQSTSSPSATASIRG